MGVVCRWWRRLFGHRREKQSPQTEVWVRSEEKDHTLTLEAPTKADQPKASLTGPGPQVHQRRRDLPNAPKRQPCRSCRKRVRRTRKTMGLAFYWCNKCKVETVIKLRR